MEITERTENPQQFLLYQALNIHSLFLFFFFFKLKSYLFMAAVGPLTECRLFSVAVSRGYSALSYESFSLQCLLLLCSMNARVLGLSSCSIVSVIVAREL